RDGRGGAVRRMSAALAIPVSAPRALRVHPVVALLAVTGMLLVLSQVHTEAFLWASAAALAYAVLHPFVRRHAGGLDPGEAMYPFVLYFALSLLFRGLGLLGGVDSPYVTPIGDSQSPTFRTLLA